MQRFSLPRSICALVIQDGKRVTKTLAAGQLVTLIPGQITIEGLVDVVCDEQVYSVFEEDLQETNRQARLYTQLPVPQWR